MATATQISSFCSQMGTIAQNVASSREKWVLPSVCTAQACLETGYGTSIRMMVANAPFGIKATSSWTGKVYDTVTHEVYNGVSVTENACFRAYDSVEDAVIDYMNLICSLERYSGAVCNTSPKSTISAIHDGGYATDPDYVSKIMSIISNRGLTKYDTINGVSSQANEIVAMAQSQLGTTEPSGDDKYISWYNSKTGIGFNKQVSWCAIFVSWCAGQCGISTSIVPRHASCDIGMQWFINKGLFQKSVYQGGSYVPKKGDIAYFSNDGTMSDSTHVGIVCEDGTLSTFYTIEGNTSDPSGSTSYDGVFKKKRDQSGYYVLGFGTPEYTGGYDYSGADLPSASISKTENIQKIYKVVSGDTLTTISKKFGTPIATLLAWNKTIYPRIKANYIQVGWNLIVQKGTSSYYTKYTGKSTSLVDALNSLKINSSFNNRKKIATKNGINNYKGTATQNKTLLNLLKKGKLLKV